MIPPDGKNKVSGMLRRWEPVAESETAQKMTLRYKNKGRRSESCFATEESLRDIHLDNHDNLVMSASLNT